MPRVGDNNVIVGRGVGRNGVLAACFAVLFLALGWSAYWYIAQRMAMREFHAQLEREAQFGRVWSCESLTSGGFPLAVMLDCLEPKLRVEEGLETHTLSARRAVIQAQLYTPKLVEISLSTPASVETTGVKTSIDWSSLQISARGLPDRLDRLSIVGRDLTVSSRDLPTTTAETLHFHLKRTGAASMSPYSLTAGLAGLNSPAFARYIGPGGRGLFTILGAVTQLDAASAGHWVDRLESWRAAGGRLSIAALSLSRDDFALQAEGALGLDFLHRPDGRLAVNLRNAGPTLLAILESAGKLQRNTISGQIAAAVLSKGDLKLDMSADNGALSIGPLRRAFALPPLY